MSKVVKSRKSNYFFRKFDRFELSLNHLESSPTSYINSFKLFAYLYKNRFEKKAHMKIRASQMMARVFLITKILFGASRFSIEQKIERSRSSRIYIIYISKFII